MGSTLNWKKVVFYDETTFQMYRNTIKVYYKENQPPPQKAMPKHLTKFTFGGPFSAKGLIGYFMFTENMDGDLYRQILNENLFDNASNMMGKSWTFNKIIIPNIQLRQQQNYSSQNVQNCWTGPLIAQISIQLKICGQL